MANKDIIFLCASTSFEKTELGPDVYRKELIYPGHFVKKDAKGSVEFELPVDETLLDHWVATFNKMKAAGIEVPVPIEHTTDPEQRRGTVVDLKKEMNPERKEPALYAYIKFRDQPTGDALSKTTQVSLFSPPDFVDGKGIKYVRPIRHVALTDYPLVPGLAGFEKAIAASLVLSQDKETQMSPISDLADQLGVEYPQGATDEEIKAAIVSAWNSDVPMDGTDEELDPLEGEDPLGEDDSTLGEEDPTMEDDAEFGDDPMMEDDAGFGDDPMMEEEDPVPQAPVSASIVTQVSKARRTELEQLVRDRKITPAVRDRLASQYTTAGKVAFALSHSNADDGFDGIVAALSLNKPAYRTGSRTMAQAVDGSDSPLVVDADRRAKRK